MTALALSPDGNVMLIGLSNGSVNLHAVESGRFPFPSQALAPNEGRVPWEKGWSKETALNSPPGPVVCTRVTGDLICTVTRFAAVPVRAVGFYGEGPKYIVASSEEPGVRVISCADTSKVGPDGPFCPPGWAKGAHGRRGFAGGAPASCSSTLHRC